MIGSILDTIYESDYFALILMIAIIFLVVLFLIVLFMGKKDKKKREVEATKKLEQINENAFKEESVVQDVAVAPAVSEPVLDNVNIDSGVINNFPEFEENISTLEETKNEPMSEPVNMNSEIDPVDNIVTPSFIEEDVPVESITDNLNNVEPIIEEPVISVPEIEPISEDIPSVNVEINPINSYTTNEVKNNDTVRDEVVVNIPEINIPEVEIPSVDISEFEDIRVDEEKPAPVLEPISVPDFNFDSIVKDATKVEEEPKITVKPAPQIFSSVYVPREEVKEDLVKPILEEPIVKEETKDIEEEEFELPTLKKDVVKEHENEKEVIPVFEDYDLDSLSGETYDIK